MKAIQTLGLTKDYGNRVACDHIHLSVNQGEIFGLLGPNGAGKSTLVKMLVGLVNPSAGSARVLGFPFGELAVRRRIGYLPELFRYQPWLTADEVLAFHAGLLGISASAEEREQLLARVGLGGRGADRVRSFSKGLQQRLGLAVTLVGKPDLIFLDEPTSALDPIGRHDVSQLLLELREQGVTVFLNSHLLSDVEKLCDSVALIDQGKILYQGSLEAAISGGVHQYQLRVSALTEDGAFMIREEYATAVIQWGQRTGDATLRVRGLREVLPSIVAKLVGVGARVYEVEPDHSSLEEWFLSRVGKDEP